jgi:hypothetical protein
MPSTNNTLVCYLKFELYFQFLGEDIKGMWNTLKTQYNRFKKTAKGETGKATEETAKKWKFFDKMTFLETANVPVERFDLNK